MHRTCYLTCTRGALRLLPYLCALHTMPAAARVRIAPRLHAPHAAALVVRTIVTALTCTAPATTLVCTTRTVATLGSCNTPRLLSRPPAPHTLSLPHPPTPCLSPCSHGTDCVRCRPRPLCTRTTSFRTALTTAHAPHHALVCTAPAHSYAPHPALAPLPRALLWRSYTLRSSPHPAFVHTALATSRAWCYTFDCACLHQPFAPRLRLHSRPARSVPTGTRLAGYAPHSLRPHLLRVALATCCALAHAIG